MNIFLQKSLMLSNKNHIIITTQRIPNFLNKDVPILSQKFQLPLSGIPENDAIEYLKEEIGNYNLSDIDFENLRDFVRQVECLPLALVSLIRHFRNKPKGKISIEELVSSAEKFSDYLKSDKENGQRYWLTEQLLELSAEERLILSVLSAFNKPCPAIALEYMLPKMPSDQIDKIVARLERDLLIYQEGEGYQLSTIIRECVYNLIP